MTWIAPPEPTAEDIEAWDRKTAHRRFVLRTIHDGHVRINGKTYAPNDQHLAYDGRLDGMRFAFGLYDGFPFVSLWGTERTYNSDDPDADWPGPQCVDGGFPWLWWRAAASRTTKQP